nr:transposase [Rubellimicrobium roseum]
MRLAPLLFVLIWSTGIVDDRAIAPHADPNLFLAARFAIAALLLAQLTADEVFVKVNGVQHCLLRAVDQEGEVLEANVTKTRDKGAALKFLKKLTKRHGRAEELVTDGLKSDGAAFKEIGAEDRQVTGRRENNRVENSHQPFRRRERAMLRFRRMHSLQKFAAVHGSVHNHFNAERTLTSRDTYKQARTAALSEWRQLCAG